jgi:hypothetical protein
MPAPKGTPKGTLFERERVEPRSWTEHPRAVMQKGANRTSNRVVDRSRGRFAKPADFTPVARTEG